MVYCYFRCCANWKLSNVFVNSAPKCHAVHAGCPLVLTQRKLIFFVLYPLLFLTRYSTVCGHFPYISHSTFLKPPHNRVELADFRCGLWYKCRERQELNPNCRLYRCVLTAVRYIKSTRVLMHLQSRIHQTLLRKMNSNMDVMETKQQASQNDN